MQLKTATNATDIKLFKTYIPEKKFSLEDF